LRAAFAATRIAEAFRDEGADVVLMMDSLTRVAMAQREIGLSAGEPPATRGYPPSTFSLLAQLLERAGTGEIGSITGLYTDLVDVGAYKPGTNPKVDAAVAHADAIDAFLQQGIGEPADAGESWMRLERLIGMLGGA